MATVKNLKRYVRGVIHLLSHGANILFYNRKLEIDKIKNIVLFKIDNIGDILMALPAILSIRKAFPAAKITMVVHPAAEEIALRVSDRVFPYTSSFVYESAEKGRASPLYVVMKAKELNREKFDLIIDFRSDPMTVLFSIMSRAPYRIEISNERIGPDIKKLWTELRGMAYGPQNVAHESDLYFKAIEKMGIGNDLDSFAIKNLITEKDRESIENILNEQGIRNDKSKLVVLHPGASWAHKRWSPSNFKKLAKRLAIGQGAILIFVGSKSEYGLVEDICRGLNRMAVNMAGKTTLMQLAALLERSSLAICNDSAVGHLASQCRTPLISLFGAQAPAIFGPRGTDVHVIKKEIPCSPCKQISCSRPPDARCMDLITVEEVEGLAKGILNSGRHI